MRKKLCNDYYTAELYMPQQVIESMALIESTSNPSTFFGRYEFAIERASILAEIPGSKIAGRSSKRVLELLLRVKDRKTIAFINRCDTYYKYNRLVDYVNENDPDWSLEVEEYYEDYIEREGEKYE